MANEEPAIFLLELSRQEVGLSTCGMSAFAASQKASKFPCGIEQAQGLVVQVRGFGFCSISEGQQLAGCGAD